MRDDSKIMSTKNTGALGNIIEFFSKKIRSSEEKLGKGMEPLNFDKDISFPNVYK